MAPQSPGKGLIRLQFQALGRSSAPRCLFPGISGSEWEDPSPPPSHQPRSAVAAASKEASVPSDGHPSSAIHPGKKTTYRTASWQEDLLAHFSGQVGC